MVIQRGSNMTGTELWVNKSQFVPVIFEPPCTYVFLHSRYTVNVACTFLHSEYTVNVACTFLHSEYTVNVACTFLQSRYTVNVACTFLHSGYTVNVRRVECRTLINTQWECYAYTTTFSSYVKHPVRVQSTILVWRHTHKSRTDSSGHELTEIGRPHADMQQ
jgi:hypothetical protein